MREKEKSTQIIFVRHGQPDFPTDRLYNDAKEDPVLTELGHQQAKAVADLFVDEEIDAIYVSPMQRTQMTAKPIIEQTGAPVFIDERLKERPFGHWDGMYFDVIMRDYPEDFKTWKRDPANFLPEGGESIKACMTRVTSAVADIIEKHKGKTVVVVAHVGPIRLLVCDANYIPVDHYRQIRVDYCSLTRIDYGSRQNNFIYMNRGCGCPLSA